MTDEDNSLRYHENAKHKLGAAGEGPPRWFPSTDSLCPDDISSAEAQALLVASIEARDDAHPNARARVALDGRGASSKRIPKMEVELGMATLFGGRWFRARCPSGFCVSWSRAGVSRARTTKSSSGVQDDHLRTAQSVGD